MGRKFLMPKVIYNGAGALLDSAATLKVLGKKAFIVTDDMMLQLGNHKKLTDILDSINIPYVTYHEINAEPTDMMIYKGLELYHKEKCDFLIAIGGGSPIDSMKAIAMMDRCKGTLTEQMGKVFTNARPKMVAIPTTAGTGSECTMFTIINDTTNNVKMLLTGSSLIPDVAIIDPIFTMTAPKSVTSATGIDALCHAIEAFTSRKSQTLSETMALSSIEKIFRYLPVCYDEPENVEARYMMALAATEAGISFNNSSVTIIHGMSRPIGANFHIAHGLSNAMLIEECLKYVKEPITDKLAIIARRANLSIEVDDNKATDDFFKALHQLLNHLNIPKMSDVIQDKKLYINLIEKMAYDAMISGSPSNTIKKLSADDLKIIYRKLIED